MSAGEHLSGQQFMTTHELRQHWDPMLNADPETFRAKHTTPEYMHRLAADIKANGLQHPVQLTRRSGSDWPERMKRPYIYDGHHRVLAAEDLGMEKLPVQWVSGKPGEQ